MRKVRFDLAAIVLAISAALVGAYLIVHGMGESPAAAPLPHHEFSMKAEAVKNPSGKAPEVPRDTVSIPAIGVSAPLVANSLDSDGNLPIPEDVSQLTWWNGSASIDALDGAVLVAGHVDNRSQGAGALYRLHELQPGAAVFLDRDGTLTRWKVIEMTVIDKTALPDDVFRGARGDRELILVTCGGDVVRDEGGRSAYRDNVIVTAAPY
ncbi:class F sortase [Nocardia camponoti]|uniref:Class F sortase n=1 Tax=Nocardia camponoti TaxID=1616106 RepID=A0A917V962_9NOCA|nr:class F sortase [Nocardia camponoti]GGK52081.1 class F sortase [Nocardia camponoti]